MFELNLPNDIDSLEIGVRRSSDISHQECTVGLRVPRLEPGYEFPGWPVYSKLGYPAKFVPVGKKNENHKFTTIKATAIRGKVLQLTVLPKSDGQIPVSNIAVVGRTNGGHRYVWTFEVNND